MHIALLSAGGFTLASFSLVKPHQSSFHPLVWFVLAGVSAAIAHQQQTKQADCDLREEVVLIRSQTDSKAACLCWECDLTLMRPEWWEDSASFH